MKSKNSLQDGLLAVECYKKIQQAIIDGWFTPGQKLKIMELKTLYGVGQSPLREALSRLIESGLIQTQNNRGFFVAPVVLEEVLDTYQVFFDIEMMALQKAMQCGDDAWEANIVGALHQLSLLENRSKDVTYAAWAERNYAFHMALIGGCNSPLLLELRSHVYKRFDRYCRIAFYLAQTRLSENHEEHQALADAVLQRNAVEVESLMRHHIFGAQAEVLAVFKKNNVF